MISGEARRRHRGTAFSTTNTSLWLWSARRPHTPQLPQLPVKVEACCNDLRSYKSLQSNSLASVSQTCDKYEVVPLTRVKLRQIAIHVQFPWIRSIDRHSVLYHSQSSTDIQQSSLRDQCVEARLDCTSSESHDLRRHQSEQASSSWVASTWPLRLHPSSSHPLHSLSMLRHQRQLLPLG